MWRYRFSRHSASIRDHLNDDHTLDQDDYKTVLQNIHTSADQKTIDRLGPNSVLGQVPPAISPVEKLLDRVERSTLAQLRTGQCRRLNSFLQMTGQLDDATCPECLFRRHTSRQLFNCDAAPTTMTVESLWTAPVAVISFLRSLPSFSFLLPAEPPAPRLNLPRMLSAGLLRALGAWGHNSNNE